MKEKPDRNYAPLSHRILQPGVEPGDLEHGGDDKLYQELETTC